MFRLPAGIPSNKASIYELTDFLECECIRSSRGRISAVDIISSILVGSDEIDIAGVINDYDRLHMKTEEIFTEVDRRREATNTNYPFRVRGNGLEIENRDGPVYWTYCYLLFCTRFNMKVDRTMAGIDGSLLFEKFSAFVAKEYFGNRAEAMVFGTAEQQEFIKKVNNLCQALGEGGGFENRNEVSPDQVKDDKLDIVVWINFADRKASKLIGFGQCKTGMTWRNDYSLTQLRPVAFCKKWLRRQPAHDPSQMFFVADSFYLDTWFGHACDAGIVFDRFRMMDYLPTNENFQNGVYTELISWTREAIERISA